MQWAHNAQPSAVRLFSATAALERAGCEQVGAVRACDGAGIGRRVAKCAAAVRKEVKRVRTAARASANDCVQPKVSAGSAPWCDFRRGVARQLHHRVIFRTSGSVT